jgi:hypothetical protein
VIVIIFSNDEMKNHVQCSVATAHYYETKTVYVGHGNQDGYSLVGRYVTATGTTTIITTSTTSQASLSYS